MKNKGKDPGVTASGIFFEWEACYGAGLDLWKWENGIYSNSFKARVMAWYEAHRLVEAHSQDVNIKGK